MKVSLIADLLEGWSIQFAGAAYPQQIGVLICLYGETPVLELMEM